MNSKKLITLLVLTTMIFAMVPYVPMAKADLNAGPFDYTNDDKAAWNSPVPLGTPQGEKGHTIWIEGPAGSVASGYEVMVYWDKIQDWDGVKGHLNTTEADDDGGFEVWFDVPESPVGNHYLWFTATDQETKRSETFKIIPDCDISTGSGLAGSKIYVDLWGFSKTKEVAVLFVEEGIVGEPDADWNDVSVTGELLLTTAVSSDTYTGMTTMYAPIQYATADVVIYVDGDWAGSYDGAWSAAGNGGYELLVPGANSINLATGTIGIQLTAAAPVDVDITVDYEAGRFYVAAEDLEETVDPDEDEYDGTLDNDMVEPGSFTLTIGAHTFYDDNGKIFSNAADEECGTLNYVTGEWEIDLDDTGATEAGAFTAEYDWFADIRNHAYVLTTSGLTDSLGTWENRRVTVPSGAAENQYYVLGFDGKGNDAYDDFEIGAVITLSTDIGAVGDKVQVDGEGFAPNSELQAQLIRGGTTLGVHIIDSEGAAAGDDMTDGDGEFTFDIIIPGADKKDDDWEIRVFGGGYEAVADFEIVGLATVDVDPDFGPQGSTITVSGENFQNIKDKKVKIALMDGALEVAVIEDSVKLDSDGSFEVDVTVPTENDKAYDIKVTALADDDGPYNIDDDVEFRIGTIMILLSKGSSVVGDRIVLTGNGFTEDGEWNATFGDETIFEEEQCVDGLLKADGVTPEFFVPQLPPGEYTILVWDVEAEITVETEFEVTEYTVLEFELLEAPNEFNVSIEGWNWPEVIQGGLSEEDEIKFVLWNETDEWDMDVKQLWDHDDDDDTDKQERTAILNGTGFLNYAWWVVPDDETLDKGTYWVNATIETDNEQEYFMQLEFVIGDVHIYSAPRKATFRIGDTVSFKLQHTFGNDANQPVKGGDLKIYDPDGELYWDGDPLNTWSKVQNWYECPSSAQTASGNPMILLDDAPLGAWSYKWREKDGDVIKEGSFNVEASAEDVLNEQIEDLNSAIEDLTSDVASVTDAVAGVQSNVNSAIAAANAAVEAANAAVDAVNSVAGTASQAAEAAQNAADAAEAAQNAASGLTTLVYGAIGASLVAALAAIVSLMQISRRIAG